MNTHDVDKELPPLPEPAWVDGEPYWYDRHMEAYARAAIKPYQKRIEELEAQLEAIGAGGVSSQRITSPSRGEAVANCWSNDGGDNWLDHPAESDFVDGLKVGDEYELLASVSCWTERFRVIKAPDETSDDYEVEPVSIRTAPQPADPDYKQLFEQMCERCDALDAKLAEYSEREPVALDRYDAGYLGGQDGMPAYVWHDIIRAELDRAYDFYMDQLDRATRQPAEPVKVPSSFPTGTEYSVEPHGNGYAIYQGRDQFHHGLNLAHLTECTPEFSKRIESALNAMHEPEGWQLVPKEPTEEMLAATSWPNCASIDYKHMLEAAPKFGEEK